MIIIHTMTRVPTLILKINPTTYQANKCPKNRPKSNKSARSAHNSSHSSPLAHNRPSAVLPRSKQPPHINFLKPGVPCPPRKQNKHYPFTMKTRSSRSPADIAQSSIPRGRLQTSVKRAPRAFPFANHAPSTGTRASGCKTGREGKEKGEKIARKSRGKRKTRKRRGEGRETETKSQGSNNSRNLFGISAQAHLTRITRIEGAAGVERRRKPG